MGGVLQGAEVPSVGREARAPETANEKEARGRNRINSDGE